MPIAAPKSVAEQALVQRDLVLRKAEQDTEATLQLLRDRKAILERSRDIPDVRYLAPLAPEPRLVHSESYLADREENLKANAKRHDISYLTQTPNERALEKQASLAKVPVLSAREKEQQRYDAVHQRVKQLIADVHKETAVRIRTMTNDLDAYGIFPTSINELRAGSVCRADLRRQLSMGTLRQEAANQINTGYDPPPKPAVRGGRFVPPTSSEVLRCRLERLDVELVPARTAVAGAPRGNMKSSQSTRSMPRHHSSQSVRRGASSRSDVAFANAPVVDTAAVLPMWPPSRGESRPSSRVTTAGPSAAPRTRPVLSGVATAVALSNPSSAAGSRTSSPNAPLRPTQSTPALKANRAGSKLSGEST